MEELFQYPAEYFNALPEKVIEDIESALQYGCGERSVGDVIADIVKGDQQVWVHTIDGKYNGMITTRVVKYPRKLTCVISCLGGEKAFPYLDKIKEVEAWALYNNCDDIEFYGRRGWTKEMKNYGFCERYVVMGKELRA